MKRCIKCLAATWFICWSLSPLFVSGQTPNPNYLGEMPSPERVIREIKGKDAEDTIERQMGAFQALIKMIDDMAWGLGHRYVNDSDTTHATPDERRIRLGYQTTYADLWHKAKADRREVHLYDHDRVLLGELLTKVFSPSFRDLYAKSDANAAAYYKAYREKNSGVVFTVGAGGTPAKDAVHDLCAAKGLDEFTCMMQTMMKGVMGAANLMGGPVKPGLRLSGGYLNGNLSMRFDTMGKAWVNCAGVFLLSSYDVERKNDQIVLHLSNEQNPFTIALKPDGTTLVGPATVLIHGHAPGGATTAVTTPGSTQQVTKTTTEEMTAAEVQASGRAQEATQTGHQTYSVTNTTTSTEYTPPATTVAPAYHPASAMCKLGVVPVRPQSPGNSAKQADGLQDFMSRIMPESGSAPDGLRMAGVYDGPGGASVEFLPDKAIVSCRATLVERPYTVSYRDSQLLVKLAGVGGPQTFTLTPEGTLLGDNGTVPLNGRRKIGENQIGDPTYAPSSDTCSYGVLSPRGGTHSSAGQSGSPNVTSVPRQADINTTSPVHNSNDTVGTGTLSVAASLVGPVPKPLNGVPVFFLKESAEDVLRKSGFVSAVGTSALATWAEACKIGGPNCAKGVQVIEGARVNAAKFDANGRVAFANVPVGTYWAVIEVHYNNKFYLWNQKINIRPGTNAVSLDQNNATLIF